MQNNSYPSMVDPVATPKFGPAAPGQAPQNTGAPLASQHMFVPEQKPKKNGSLIQTIFLILATITALVFIALYINKYIEWDNARTDVDSQIDAAVAMAVADNTTKMEADFAEREKYPYRNFMGPADYGSLGFEYPQTWSVYISKDASNGGDFEAYLNPTEVEPVSATTINALRVTIRDDSFDSVIRTYDNFVRNGRCQFSTREVNGVMANVYTGELSNEIYGKLVVFKLRDKAVMLQTDADVFVTEFDRLIDTVTFVQ